MPRIFLPDADLNPGPVTLRDEKARYLTAVLRCSAGDPLVVKGRSGDSYSARITGVTKKEVVIDILEQLDIDTESPLHLTLVQGLLKGEKMDLVIQKATELGVSEIIPAVTERSQVRETRKLPRWRKIAEEASRQSGRTVIPIVHEVTPFETSVIDASVASREGVIFWEEGGMNIGALENMFRGRKKLCIITGPEGGFSEKEIMHVSRHGFATATLGRRILRAETASIVALSVIQYAFGDLGK